MREIKFRAWDKKRKKMIYYTPEVDPKNCGYLVYCDMETLAIGLDGYLYLLDECGNWECPKSLGEDYEIMQYTGLKDKNGREIYEGDIIVVRVLHDGDEYCWDNEKQEPIPQLVKWDERRCSFDFGHASRICYCPHHFEVIGNIFENPETLKKLKELP